MSKRASNKGFTIVEVIVTFAILAILASISLANYDSLKTYIYNTITSGYYKDLKTVFRSFDENSASGFYCYSSTSEATSGCDSAGFKKFIGDKFFDNADLVFSATLLISPGSRTESLDLLHCKGTIRYQYSYSSGVITEIEINKEDDSEGWDNCPS